MDDIIAIGEILIDLIGTGPLQFRGTVGGAPCNALAQAAKLGSRTAFIGMVGQDAFGRICAGQLDELGIDRTHLAVTDRADTTLAFVTLDENGEETTRSEAIYDENGTCLGWDNYSNGILTSYARYEGDTIIYYDKEGNITQYSE